MKKFLLLLTLVFFISGTYAKADCPNYGDASDAKRKTTNISKNRNIIPGDADIDGSVTIFKMLNSQDDENAFDEHKAATITGYLFKAKKEGPESCNCHSSNEADHDIHIFIAPDKNTSSIGGCVVIEITPWVKTQHPDWTADYLNSIKGHKVTVTGWLLYDWEHKGQSAASHPDLDHPARGTVWELHPIAAIEDLDSDADAVNHSSVTGNNNFFNDTPPANNPTTNKPAMQTTQTPLNIFIILLLGSFLGMLGQGLRVWVGISKANADPANRDKEMKDIIETKRIVISFLYAFIIGGLTGSLMALDGIDKVWDKNFMMGIITAGYAGTDFIEGFIHKNFK